MVQVGFFVIHIQLLEGPKLLALFDEGLDDRNAGEAFLGEVGQLGECLLPQVPLDGQLLTHDGGGRHQENHGNQGQQRQQMVHLPHVPDGENAQQHRVEEHHNAPTEALLNGIQVVGEQAHQVAHLVDLVVLPAQVLGMVKHLVPKLRFQPDCGAQEAESPQKPAQDDCQNDSHHGHTDIVQQKVQVEGHADAVYIHHAIVHAVDEHPVQLGNFQLQEVYHSQRNQTQQQSRTVLQVISVDMLTEYHDLCFLSINSIVLVL